MALRSISPEPCPECAAPCPCIADATLIGKPNTYECSAHGMFEAGKLTRVRRRCTKCGHLECPGCRAWCDVLVRDEDGDSDLCCDGECTYEA